MVKHVALEQEGHLRLHPGSHKHPTHHHWHFRSNGLLHGLLRHLATLHHQQHGVGAHALGAIENLMGKRVEHGSGHGTEQQSLAARFGSWHLRVLCVGLGIGRERLRGLEKQKQEKLELQTLG